MQKQKTVLISILLISTVVISISIPLTIRYRLPSDGTIRITSDNDFLKYNLSGEGTKDNPFIIESRNINSTDNVGILVKDTTKYFIIRNNFLLSNYEYGIYIENIASKTAIKTRSKYIRYAVIRALIADGYPLKDITDKFNAFYKSNTYTR